MSVCKLLLENEDREVTNKGFAGRLNHLNQKQARRET